MTVRNVIDLAKAGELNNVAVGNNTDAVLGYINLGLIELYKRFPLNVQEYLLTLDGSEIYTMPADYMWIVAAYDEVPADSLVNTIQIPINEENNPLSLNTVSWNQIQVPVDTAGATISIIYTAAPTMLTTADLDMAMPIPIQMLEALLHYIGYRAHGSVDGNIQGENNTHYQRFELSCRKIEEMGMFTSDDVAMPDRIFMKGFV